MAHPARHEIQKHAPGLRDGSVVGGERSCRRVIDVCGQPGGRVEIGVGGFVLFAEGVWR